MRVGVWVLEPLNDGSGGNNNLYDALDNEQSSKQPIKRECDVTLTIKTDYQIGGCGRPEPFTPPVVAAEITFQSTATSKTKELFKQTDSNPWVNPYFADPTWKSFVPLRRIDESGVLQVKITMRDPDTGTVRTINEKFTIDIITPKQDPKLCCRCIS